MTTKHIAHHTKTQNIALFQTDNSFWIGSYSVFCTHQNSEPPYVWIAGNFATEMEGRAYLENMTGEEF
jgi:hypothetical protein